MTEQLQAALRIAEHLGLPKTFPNLRTIEAAIESEAESSAISIDEAEDVIVAATADARKFGVSGSGRVPRINRFFFEDALWRETYIYAQYQKRRRMDQTA